MVRFSCFPSHIHTHKQKKSVQSSPGPNGNYSASHISKNSTNFEMKSPSELNTNELDWKSEQIENKSNTESDLSIRKDSRMRKSISLGSLLNHEANESDYESDHKFSPNRSELIIESSSKVQESIFTIADPDLGIEKFSPRAHRNTVKSKSTSDLRLNLPTHHPSLRKCKSSEGIYVIDKNMKEISPQHEDRNVENALEENYDTYNYIGSAKEWIVPVTNENINGKLLSRWDNIPSEDFKHKRIQEWVFDLQHYDPLDETHETNEEKSFHLEPKNDSISSKLDGKLNQNQNQNQTMEGVKRYLTSLNPSSTTAQLVNHGLTVIPFLSAFTSLKALNLSGNSIGKITAGTLPRGLHVLNLSKNNISTIEGLRELTRLRILDLSYNRILRLGHGLASCSSLKELYLAGNKISEVEGLHRLLKLNVLDLRFNKISTTKCLGQLAANYNSLQAIGLDGNPAQKNIGDEHLKKYLQGLLPHLAYYNRQAVKTTKDSNGRGERNLLRSEMKSSVRKSSLHGRKSVAAVGTSSRSRNGRVPVVPTHGGTGTGTKGKFYEFGGGNKLLNFKSHLSISMHKSRSEGTLAAL